MNRNLLRFLCTAILALGTTTLAFGQATTTLTGTVVDKSGGVIPGVDVTVKNNATNAESKTVTEDNGSFVIPALGAGTYTVTVTAPGFKQAVLSDVRIIAATPATVRVTMELGNITESVTVQGGGEVLQSQTANISTTLETRQISNLPLQSRNTIYALQLLPGVSSSATASPRNSTINGLPSSAYNITIDGLNTQDNLNKNSDGFFSYINPTLDAVQEVTISTATPGAESAGQGAIQIKFVTRGGSNEYHGSLYEYHRNPVLNSNYWFNNRDGAARQDAFPHAVCGQGGVPYDPKTCHALRDRVLFNQMGGRVGGPIRFPGLFNGKDRAFFFVNFEEFRQPTQITRTRTILNPITQGGVFQYTTSSGTQTVDLLALASRNGQASTYDPTVKKLLSEIAASTVGNGGIVQQTNPNLQTFTFANSSMGRRYFPTVRFDFNLSSKHRLENVYNYQSYVTTVDTLNSVDPAFPGFPNHGGQFSNRFTDNITLRSTLTPRLVNEARAGLTGGTVLFFPEINAGQFTNQQGFSLGIGAAGITSATVRTAPSRRNAPIWDYADTLTWTKGSHSLSFGGQWTQAGLWNVNQTVVPSITMGMASGDPALSMFTTANFPGASTTNLTDAQNLYAVLSGRITAITANAILDEKTNKYGYLASQVQRAQQREMGFFAQDSWRMRPGLTLTYGLRWEIQLPFTLNNDVIAGTTPDGVWGISGPGNLFKPGTQTGSVTKFSQIPAGQSLYNTDYKNFAPSFGFAWSPKTDMSWLRKILGGGGQTVFRGGYSIAYNRQGSASVLDTVGSNPGITLNATRSTTIGNLVTGTGSDTLPVLLSQTGRLGPPSFASTPTYPFTGSITDQVNIFDPHLRTPYTQSWSIGIQRELTKNMALEVRYVHTLNLQQWIFYNLNETNIKENGFLDEFKLAQKNLQSNIAANRGNTFAYTGAPGTSPLPTYLAYFSGVVKAQSGDTTKYTSSNFTSGNFVNPLASNNPAPFAPASSNSSTGLYGSATFRNNAIAAGLPSNQFLANPDLLGGAFIQANGGSSRYDGLQVDLRKRLSKGLLMDTNYTFAKGFAGASFSLRQRWVNQLNTNNGGTIQHALKVNWIYELPIGKGRWLLNSPRGFAGNLLDRVLGGWEIDGTGRIQSGAILNLGAANLVGMTVKDLQDAYKVRFDNPPNKFAYIFPQDIIDNTIKAFSVSSTSATGYGSLGAPTGRYLAPANSFGCIAVVTGDCSPQRIYLHGPRFVRFDLSAIKRIKMGERANFEMRAEFLNAFNNINFLGSTNLNPSNASNNIPSSNLAFGQVTSAYRDVNNTQDPGGRLVQLVARINF